MKCVICDRDTEEMYDGCSPRCVDTSDCIAHRKTLRMLKEIDLTFKVPFIECRGFGFHSIFKEFKTVTMCQYADFVAVQLENGGVMFLKDRYTAEQYKTYFAE